jgi:hypothetical protein
MADSAPTQPHDDGADAWMRHYAAAAERRRAAAALRRRPPDPYFRHRRREARWALAFTVAVAALLIAAWAASRWS